MLFAVVRRGKKSEIHVFPHRYREDDRYHVSLTNERPHIPLNDIRDIPAYLENGYSLGMSNGSENCGPKLIKPEAIRGWK